MLAAMYRRRLPGFKELGFTPDTVSASETATPPQRRLAEPERAADDPERDPTAAQVRAWARAPGPAVSERGRLPAELWQAYREAGG